MRLYIVLLVLPFLTPNFRQSLGDSSNLWFTQNNITMTNEQQELYTQLKAKKEELKQFLKEKNLSPNVLNKEQRKIVVKANKVLKACEEEIGEPTFSEAVIQWKTKLKGELKTLQNKYKDVIVNYEKFSSSISENASTIPINQALYAEWAALIANLETEPRTGKTVFDAIINSSQPTWGMASNPQQLTQHYKKNRKFYKKYDVDLAGFQDRTLPQISLFEAALEASVDKGDENHPDVIAEKEEHYEKFAEKYVEWVTGLKTHLDTAGRSYKGNIMDISILADTRTVLQSPDYAKEFWKDIADEIEAEIRDGKLITIERATSIATQKLIDYSAGDIVKELSEKHKEDVVHTFPSGLAKWLVDGSEDIGIEVLDKIVVDWKNEVAAAIDICVKDKFDNKNTKLARAKLKAKLLSLFNKKIATSSAQPALPVYNLLLDQFLPQEEYFYTTDLQQAWSKTLEATIQTDFMDKIYNEHILIHFEDIPTIKKAIKSLKSVFPSQASLITACAESKFVPKAKINEEVIKIDTDRRDTLQIDYVLHWGTRPSAVHNVADSAISEIEPLAKKMIPSVRLMEQMGFLERDQNQVAELLKENDITISVVPVKDDTVTFKLPWFWNKTADFPYLDLAEVGRTRLSISKLSDYELVLDSIYKEKPIIRENSVINQITFKLKVTNVVITKELSFIAGSSTTPAPPAFNLVFTIEVVSLFVNGKINAYIDSTGGLPDCPMLEKTNPPILQNEGKYNGMNPFPE